MNEDRSLIDIPPIQLLVLHRVSEGQRYIEVAKELGCAESTVSDYMTDVRRLLGAKTTAHAITTAFRSGILS